MSWRRILVLALVIGFAAAVVVSLCLYIYGTIYVGWTIGDLEPILEGGAGIGLAAFLLALMGLVLWDTHKRFDK